MSAPEPEPVEIRGDTIALAQLLKLVGAVDSGGGARALLEAGEVLVDGEPEARRGRKLHAGSTVTVGGRAYVVRLEADEREVEVG